MNKFYLPIFALSAIISTQAIADDAHHPERQNPAAMTAPAASGNVGKTVNEMKENTKKMQAQLDKIRQAKDPQERQKLLLEHMHTMRKNMMLGKSMMGEMMGCPMMKDGMMKEGMMGGGMGMMGGDQAPDAAMNRMNMMEKRMDMMQMMMEQMKSRQEAQQPVPMTK